MKILMISLVQGLLCITACKAASTDTIAEVRTKVVELHITHKEPKKAELKKLRIRVEDYVSHAICSGSFITSNGYILTAKHCTENTESIDVVANDGLEYHATIMAESKDHDLAVLRIDKMNTPYFRLADKVEQGEQISTYGSPLGIGGTLSTGIVAKLMGDVTLIDCSALPGNSGGAVFDENGELVGVLTSGFIVLYGTTHLNIMQSLEAVNFFKLELQGQR